MNRFLLFLEKGSPKKEMITFWTSLQDETKLNRRKAPSLTMVKHFKNSEVCQILMDSVENLYMWMIIMFTI